MRPGGGVLVLKEPAHRFTLTAGHASFWLIELRAKENWGRSA
jgi:hypothetical protein